MEVNRSDPPLYRFLLPKRQKSISGNIFSWLTKPLPVVLSAKFAILYSFIQDYCHCEVELGVGSLKDDDWGISMAPGIIPPGGGGADEGGNRSGNDLNMDAEA